MEKQATLILLRRIGMTVFLAACFGGLETVPAANAQTNQSSGIDNATVTTTTTKRDPFWPVGYTPKVVVENKPVEQDEMVEQVGKVDWYKAMKQVSIQGVSSRAGNEFFAVINGQVKGAGETVSVRTGGVSYTWMIESISPPSSVKLRRVSAQ